jgi:predicted Zn-dependent protease
MIRSVFLAVVVCLGALAVFTAWRGPAVARDETALRRTVRQLDRQGWIATRGHTDAHITLAAIEMAHGKTAPAARLLLTALRTGPQPVAVRIAAIEALSAGGGEDGRRRAAALAEDGVRFGTAEERRALDEAAARLGLERADRPGLPKKLPKVRVLALGPIDSQIPAAMARAVSRELGADVEVTPLPDFAFSGRSRRAGWSRQYDADAINAALLRDHGAPGSVILAVTEVDLYAPGLNFVWASGGGEASIVSSARLRGEDDGLTRARLAKQALTSLLDLFGAPRATHPGCVNANALTLAEFDAKTETICAETRLFFADGGFRREAAR